MDQIMKKPYGKVKNPFIQIMKCNWKLIRNWCDFSLLGKIKLKFISPTFEKIVDSLKTSQVETGNRVETTIEICIFEIFWQIELEHTYRQKEDSFGMQKSCISNPSFHSYPEGGAGVISG